MGGFEQVNGGDPTRWVYTAFREYNFFIPLTSAQPGSERALEEMDNAALREETMSFEASIFPIRSSPASSICAGRCRDPSSFCRAGIPLAIRVHRGGRSIGLA